MGMGIQIKAKMFLNPKTQSNQFLRENYVETWLDKSCSYTANNGKLNVNSGITPITKTLIPEKREPLVYLTENTRTIAQSDEYPTKGVENSETVYRNQILPDRYTGRTPLKDYLIHFEICSDLNKWSTIEKAQYLAISLKGKAQQVLSILTMKELKCYESLKAALKQKFPYKDQSELFFETLQNRVKWSHESFTDLASSIHALVKGAYPLAATDRVNFMTCHYFIRAIPDKTLREHIMFAKVNNVTDAIKFAENYGSIAASVRSNVEVNKAKLETNSNSKDEPSCSITNHYVTDDTTHKEVSEKLQSFKSKLNIAVDGMSSKLKAQRDSMLARREQAINLNQKQNCLLSDYSGHECNSLRNASLNKKYLEHYVSQFRRSNPPYYAVRSTENDVFDTGDKQSRHVLSESFSIV